MNLMSRIIQNIDTSSYIEEKVIINQPIEKVWKEFQIIENYSLWNSLFSLENFPSHVGEKISLKLYAENKEIKFSAKVLKIEPYSLEWEGKLYVNGLFNGRHLFTFEALDDDRTLLVQSEIFIGILVPILRKSIIQSTQKNFQKVNYAFKNYIEELV